jgi:hypothetical protein
MDDDVWVTGLEFSEVLDPNRTPLLARAAVKGRLRFEERQKCR